MVLALLLMVFVLVSIHLRWPDMSFNVLNAEEASKTEEDQHEKNIMISRPKAPPAGFGQPRGSVSAEVPMRDWNPLPAPSAPWMQPDGSDQAKPSSKVLQGHDRPVSPERPSQNKISQMAITRVPQQPAVPPPGHLQGGAYVDESPMADVGQPRGFVSAEVPSHVAEDRKYERSDDGDEIRQDDDLEWGDFHGSQDQPDGSYWRDDDWKPGAASWQPNFNQRGYGSGWYGDRQPGGIGKGEGKGKLHHPYAHFNAQGLPKTGWANKSAALVEAVLQHDWQKAHNIASTYSDEYPIKSLLELRQFNRHHFARYEIPPRPY